MFQKFRIAPGKLTGWKRLMGQEVAIDAFSELCGVAGTSAYPAFAVGLTQLVGGAAAPAAPVNDVQTSRRLTSIVVGPQTPQAVQPALNLFVPLLFWFNRDTRLSIPSVSIPFGQRFITLDIEPLENILYTAPGNLFLQLTTERFVNIGGTALGASIINYQRVVTRRAVNIATSRLTGTGATVPTITNIELYINNIFMNPEIHDIYIKRIGFSLIRIHRTQVQPINTSANEILLSQFKYPVETIYAGVRPIYNVTNPTYSGLNVASGNVNVWRDWHRFSRLVDRTCDIVSKSSSLLNAGPAGLNPSVAALTGTDANSGQRQSSTVQTDRITYTQTIPTVNTLQVKAHAINIYDTFAREFFNQYLPFNYGGWNIITPEDDGVLMINFCLYPGTYQPSGHINISRAREFYMNYTSTYVGAADLNAPQTSALQAATAEFVFIGIAINFLLISDGSAVLRYST
jgi:Large eukaryotic DNA virus major capsid protein